MEQIECLSRLFIKARMLVLLAMAAIRSYLTLQSDGPDLGRSAG